MRNLFTGISAIAFALGLGLVSYHVHAQSDEAFQPGDEDAGKLLFRSAEWTATGLTCMHCHSDFNEKRTPDGLMRPASSLYNSGFRAWYNTWNRNTTLNLQEAIEACMVRWITEREEGKNSGVLPAPHHVRQVMAFLRSSEMVVESKAKPLEPMWVDAIPGDRLLMMGDPVVGVRIFRRSCATCHVSDGTGPAPSLVRNGYSRYQIAKKLRGIDNPGLKGLVMPAFPLDRLSDRELINVVAYVYGM